ncbi:MAG: glycosyltransferase family 4 protein [Chitinophagaceae bacterium]
MEIKIKILFIVRNSLFSVKGGDTVQILETASHLKELGVLVDIKKTSDPISYHQYNLIHFFNIIRPADILPHLKKNILPYVVSTIFVDYAEFDQKNRKGLSGFVFKLLHSDAVEYVKHIARSIVSRENKIPLGYLLKGHRNALISIANNAACLLPNSESEFCRLREKYNIKNRYCVITNGVNTHLFNDDDVQEEKDPLLVICAARIEGIKNQLTLIKALNNTRFKLLLIGNPAPNQMAYYNKCRSMAADNIEFIPHLTQKELQRYYLKAKVHVLPSWFETTGLSSLEAGLMGCSLVISNRGDASEYFESNAFYCNPADPESILNAVEAAAAAPLNNYLKTLIKDRYTWERAAQLTLNVYKSILNPPA